MSSDYTPPNLVKPTPGGSPGDGTMSGKLTVNGLSVGPKNSTIDANPTYGGFYVGANTTGPFYLGSVGSTNGIHLNTKFTYYNNNATSGLGVAPLYGDDVRTGLTAADASAKTLYTTTAAGQVYEVAARIFGTGGTITSGVYTIGWTEGGVARTATVSVTAAGTLASAVFLLQPDSGTAITAQLTTLSGTSPVANVAAVVKQDV